MAGVGSEGMGAEMVRGVGADEDSIETDRHGLPPLFDFGSLGSCYVKSGSVVR